ncbi:MAG TPA: flagellar filament capping protein FliD [Rhodocyclaceae bacterium]|nr:flagellar filament capping protein FliD [Rhodocyclaceae bacterium]
MNVSANDILLQLADFRNQALNTLLGTTSEDSKKTSSSSSFSQILDSKMAGTTGSSTNGMNMSLNDPASGYNMMSFINNSEVQFKAQYSELSAMDTAVGTLETAGQQLGDKVDASTSNSDIKAQLQGFVDQYNSWIDRFGGDVKSGGILDGVQAGEASMFELEQNINNIFNGAADGIHGMGDLGITIDPTTKRATFDSSRLDSALASNKTGVVNAIDQFSANFAKSADLLNDDGNFIHNAMDNRSRAISYIENNKTSLQAEFGTGATASATGQVAQALAAYEKAHSTT